MGDATTTSSYVPWESSIPAPVESTYWTSSTDEPSDFVPETLTGSFEAPAAVSHPSADTVTLTL